MGFLGVASFSFAFKNSIGLGSRPADLVSWEKQWVASLVLSFHVSR